MESDKKVYLLSFLILLLCLALAGVLYVYTGDIVIAIFLAPPIIHWILKKRMKSEHQ